MELEEFVKYWDVSRDELAFICGCSRSNVDKWYSQGESSEDRKPKEHHKRMLELTHYIWLNLENAEYLKAEYIKKVTIMYLEKPRRVRSK